MHATRQHGVDSNALKIVWKRVLRRASRCMVRGLLLSICAVVEYGTMNTTSSNRCRRSEVVMIESIGKIREKRGNASVVAPRTADGVMCVRPAQMMYVDGTQRSGSIVWRCEVEYEDRYCALRTACAIGTSPLPKQLHEVAVEQIRWEWLREDIRHHFFAGAPFHGYLFVVVSFTQKLVAYIDVLQARIIPQVV